MFTPTARSHPHLSAIQRHSAINITPGAELLMYTSALNKSCPLIQNLSLMPFFSLMLEVENAKTQGKKSLGENDP